MKSKVEEVKEEDQPEEQNEEDQQNEGQQEEDQNNEEQKDEEQQEEEQGEEEQNEGEDQPEPNGDEEMEDGIENNNEEEATPEEPVESSKKDAANKKSESFKRVDPSILKALPTQLRDNSFQAKSRYGGGDAYGKAGHEKLRDKTGKAFRKEKGKLKNKNFQGAKGTRITYTKNSVKL